MSQDFQARYKALLAKRLSKCNCKDQRFPSLTCPVHKAQAEAEQARQILDDAPLQKEENLSFDFLGFKLAPTKTTWFVPLNCIQTRNGKLRKVTHLAVLKEHGEPLTHARHKLELYAIPEAEEGCQWTVGEILEREEPIMQAMTAKFMFHHRESAEREVRATLASQAPALS